MIVVNNVPLAIVIHYYSADYHHKDTCEDYKAGISEELQLIKVEPLVSSERGIDIYENKGKETGEQDEPYNVTFPVKKCWYWLLKVDHQFEFSKIQI
jgi:hypothetical protein